MTVKTKARNAKTGRFYLFGSYATRAEALRAASVLRKDKSLRAYAKKNTRTKKWDTMYAGVRKG